MEIDIAMVNKFYDLAVQQPQVPESLREHYRALGPTAADCVGWQSCEERCPFGVKIAERMTKAAEMLRMTNLPVAEIGRQVGYPDQLHFSRAFKSIYGLSPRNWKKEIQNL